MKPHDPDLYGRHPAVKQLAGYFDAQLTAPEYRPYAAEVEHTARTMLSSIPDCPELSVGLRKLLEARDCFIRAAAAGGDETKPLPS